MLWDMGAHLDTRKEHQATWELWEAPVSLGAWEVTLHGGGSFSWLPVPSTISLERLTFRAYNNPILNTDSFTSLSWKKIWT